MAMGDLQVVQKIMLPGWVWRSMYSCKARCGAAGHAPRKDCGTASQEGCGAAGEAARKGLGQHVRLEVWCSRSCCKEGCGAADHATRRIVVQQVMLSGV